VNLGTSCANLDPGISSRCSSPDLSPSSRTFVELTPRHRDIKSFVNLNFESFSFVYSPRVCNKVAHALAVLGASGQETCRLWTDVLPNNVMVLVASDLTVPVV
jgi:hypothetical protein